MTKEQWAEFARQGDNRSEERIMVMAHYFAGNWDWWTAEYYPKDRAFFGLVRGSSIEVGYFSINKIEKISCGIISSGGIKWDTKWKPKSLAAVRKEITDKEELIMYSPEIKQEKVQALYQIKQKTGKNLTTLVDEAIGEYLARHIEKGTLADETKSYQPESPEKPV